MLSALRSTLPVAGAFLPLGLAFGVLVTHSGLDWWWATAFATVIYAGSLEFLLLGMVLALTPLASVAVTAFLVNFRHVFYALSFPLNRVPGLPAKAYSTFALSDEAFAVGVSPAARRWGQREIITMQVCLHVAWAGSVTAGALLGTLIPPWVVGLEFAMTALFLILGVEAFRVRRDVPTALVAVGCVVFARLVAPGQFLVVALGLFVAVLILRYGWRRRIRREVVDA